MDIRMAGREQPCPGTPPDPCRDARLEQEDQPVQPIHGRRLSATKPSGSSNGPMASKAARRMKTVSCASKPTHRMGSRSKGIVRYTFWRPVASSIFSVSPTTKSASGCLWNASTIVSSVHGK